MITILTRRCATHDLPLVQVDGLTCCWTCDGVDSWPMCQPVEDDLEPMPRWRKVLVFWALVVACWVPIIVAVRWWWS